MSNFQAPIIGSIASALASLDLTSPNSGTSIVQLTGTWVGDLVVQGSNDESNYIDLYVYSESDKMFQDTITSNGAFSCNTNGYQFLRLKSVTWTSGLVSISVYGSDAASLIRTDSQIRGSSDGTLIGNVEDKIKTISQVVGNNNHIAEISSVGGELLVANRNIELEAKFLHNVSSVTNTLTELNSGTVTYLNRQCVVASNVNSIGSAILQTKKRVNYRSSQTIRTSFSAFFPDITGTVGNQVGVNNSKVLAGIFDESNGASCGFLNNGKFSIFINRDNNLIQKTSDEFSDDNLTGVGSSRYAPDFTKLQLIRISFAWHGVDSVLFEILDPNDTWLLFHKEMYINDSIVPSMGTPNLPLRFEATNTGSTSNNRVVVQSAQVSTFGNMDTGANRFFSARFTKSVTTEAPILTIQNKSIYNSITNSIEAVLEYLSLASDGNKSVEVSVYKNLTLTGASFTDIDTSESVVSVSTSATAFSGGQYIMTFELGSSNALNERVNDLELFLYPGETLTFTGKSQSSNLVTINVRFREKH